MEEGLKPTHELNTSLKFSHEDHREQSLSPLHHNRVISH